MSRSSSTLQNCNISQSNYSANVFISSPNNNNEIISSAVSSVSAYKHLAMSSVSSHSVENSGVMVTATVSPYPLTAVGMMAAVNGMNDATNGNNLGCVIRSGKIAKFGFYHYRF